MESATPLFASWESFYVIVGSSAGALTGLQFVVIRRARSQTDYTPVFEDWLWHGGLPIAAYTACLAAAVILPRNADTGLFVVAATALLLLFVGIHNAWDAVTHLALQANQKEG